MAEKIVGYVVLIILYPALFFLGLIGFSFTLSDDIEIYSGKSTRKKWSREKNLFRKYLFLDYRQHIIRWHYILLWVYIASSILSLPALILYDIFIDTEFFPIFQAITLTIMFTALLSSGIDVSIRYSLYRGNKIRRRPKKATKRQRKSVKFAKDSERQGK